MCLVDRILQGYGKGEGSQGGQMSLACRAAISHPAERQALQLSVHKPTDAVRPPAASVETQMRPLHTTVHL